MCPEMELGHNMACEYKNLFGKLLVFLNQIPLDSVLGFSCAIPVERLNISTAKSRKFFFTSLFITTHKTFNQGDQFGWSDGFG